MIADITNPLLGLDILNKFGLILDCSNKTIYDSTTTQRKSLKISASSVNLVVKKTELLSFVRNMINEKYPDLITSHKNSNKKYCGVYHRIDTGSHTSVFVKPRRLNVEKLEAACSEFKTLQKDGMISLYKSEWSSPLHIVTASSVAEAFINTWVTRWGVLLHVITDRSRQSESELFSEVAKIIGFY